MMEILLLIALYGVYKIAKEIVVNSTHLTDKEIREFKGKRRSLSHTKQGRITNHIGTCEKCRNKFTKIMNS